MAKWNKFFGPDAGGAGGAGTVVVDDQINGDDFTPQFGDNLAIVDDPGVGPSKEELNKLFEAQKAELEVLKQKEAQNAAQSAPFASLADSITKLAARPVSINAPVPQQPGENYEAYKSRIEAQFIEKPLESIQDVVSRATGPAFEALAAQTAKLAKRTAMSDSGDKDFWKAHAEEIDALAASLTPQDRLDPEAYSRIYDVVRGRHVDELFAKMQAKADTSNVPGASAVSPAQSAAGQGHVAPALSPTANSALASAKQDDGKIHITRADAEAVQNYMLQQCIPESQFERVVMRLREQGIIRKY